MPDGASPVRAVLLSPHNTDAARLDDGSQLQPLIWIRSDLHLSW